MESRVKRSAIGPSAQVDVLAATARAAIDWAWSEYAGRVCVLSSMQDAVVVDLAMQVDRRIPIVFLDTGYHFAETLETLERVEARYGIRAVRVRPVDALAADVAPGACCAPKAAMLEAVLAEHDVWISGLQRIETDARADADIIGHDRRGAIKVNPLAQWSDRDRRAYIEERDVITNPLLERGYDSIGCRTCTTIPLDGARSGRWAGSERTECGLHL